MIELLLLLPLKVLPGWPQPEPISRLHLVLLCAVGPLALGAVIAAIANAPRLMRRGRDEAAAVGLGDTHTAELAPAPQGGARRAETSIEA